MNSKWICLIAGLALAAGTLPAQDRWASGFGLDPSDAEAVREINARMDSIRAHRPTIALVLSGGGAKGAAHVGAIRHIESLGIPVDLVLGTSVGGLVGGMYALGYNGEYLDSLVRSIDWDIALSDRIDRKYIPYERNRYRETYALSVPFFYSKRDFQAMRYHDKKADLHLAAREDGASDMIRQNIFGSLPSGFVQGQNVNSLFTSISAGYSDSLDFFKLPIPYVCVATDLVSGRAKVWHSGDINTAMRSTMSIPGLFTPVRTDGMILVDGGMRNNFPADLAAEMGADLVIGVDLSQAEADYNSIHNLADIVWQGVDMLGNDSFRRNLRIVDLRIKPEIPEYNMMSFSSEAVDTIMRRGYQSALKKDEELRIIKEWTGPDTLTLQAPPAIDINMHPVMISGITFTGLSEDETDYMRNMLALYDNHLVNRSMLEDAVAKLYGTGAFDFVGYELLGKKEPFRLLFNCRKGPIHQLGVGVRFDTEEIVSVLLNLGLNVHKLNGHALDFTGKVGTNPYARLRYYYRPAKGPVFNVSSGLRYVDRNQFVLGANEFKVDYLNFRNEIYMSDFGWKDFAMQLGIRYDFYRFGTVLAKETLKEYDIDDRQNGYMGAFFNARSDTFDDGYFPKSGHRLTLDYNLAIGDLNNTVGSINAFSLNYQSAKSFGRFTFLPSIRTRVVLGDEIPLSFANVIGGRMTGRYLDQQIPFIGITNAVAVSPILATVGLDARFSFLKNHSVTLLSALGHSASELRWFISPAWSDLFTGFGVEYAYNSIVGPIRADIHWNSMTKRPGFYFSFGYDF